MHLCVMISEAVKSNYMEGGTWDMFKVEYRKIGEGISTVEFTSENELDDFLNGKTVMDINDYWVELAGAEVLKVYKE